MNKRNIYATELLNNPLFLDLISELKEDYFLQWCSSTSKETREDVYTKMCVSEDIINQLQVIALETSK